MEQEQKKKVKRVKSEFEENAYKAFREMPIDQWEEYINKESDEKKIVKLKTIARLSLKIENMAAYILAHDNTAEAKREFKKHAIGTIEHKDKTTEDKQMVAFARDYFIGKYLPVLKVEKKGKAFDLVKDWYGRAIKSE